MGTLPLWIAFNGGAALLLLLDVALFQRRPHETSLREAAIESAGWVAVSVVFGGWIFISYGHDLGLQFFTGYIIEKSLSLDNLFVFLLVFQYFRVDPRYQHRLLFWGVLGALLLRGLMVGAGVALIARFEWILYLFGAFLIFSGFKLFGADHSIHPEKNPVLRWAQTHLPFSKSPVKGPALWVHEGGKWLLTPLFLVVLVLETTDVILAVDSIPAVFGVTRDPFIVYTSNVCAILGLRALYFLLAGVLRYFQYLDEGLAVTVMFIGAKMLAEPWVHISIELSLGIVGGIIATAILISVARAKPAAEPVPAQKPGTPAAVLRTGKMITEFNPEMIAALGHSDPAERAYAANTVFIAGVAHVQATIEHWEENAEFRALIVRETPDSLGVASRRYTVGIAVQPQTFEAIRAANGNHPLADAPADQDVLEFELDFPGSSIDRVHLDILTTKAPGASGAIARYLDKFGEGIQQIEVDVKNVDRATEILSAEFNVQPIYPATRNGADGTRVNFFLVSTPEEKKVLVELVEHPAGASSHQSPVTRH